MKIEKNIPPSPLPPVQHPANRDTRASEAAAAASVPPAPASQQPVGQEESAPSRSDRVEISDEARSRAAELEGEQPAEAAPAEKRSVEEIRQRIQDGVYQSDQALDSIARRILERGDI